MDEHFHSLLERHCEPVMRSGAFPLSQKRYFKTSIPLSGFDLDALMNNHFKYIFDVLSHGLFYMTDTEHVFFYNPAFYEQFGLETGSLHINQWLDLIHPFDRAHFNHQVEEHLHGDECIKITQYRVRKPMVSMFGLKVKV